MTKFTNENGETFNMELPIAQTTIEHIKSGFLFTSKLGNIIKWYLIGAYIKNDKIEIENIENMFTKTGVFYEKRSWKTQALRVFKHLKQEDNSQENFEIINPKTEKAYTLSELAKCSGSDLRNISIEMLYKELTKKSEGENDTENDYKKDPRYKAAQALSKQGGIGTIQNPKQLLELANMGIPEFQDPLIDQLLILEKEAVLNKFPAITSDNIPDVKIAILNYMQELIALDQGEFESLYMEILAIHPQQDLQSQVA